MDLFSFTFYVLILFCLISHCKKFHIFFVVITMFFFYQVDVAVLLVVLLQICDPVLMLVYKIEQVSLQIQFF